MAGSNGSSAHRGGQAPQHWPPESEEQARALEYARWQQQQAQNAQHAQQGYAADPAYVQQGGYAQPQHGQPIAPEPHPYAPPVDTQAGYGQHGPTGHYGQAPAPQHRGGYAPQFEPFSSAHPAVPPDPYGRYEPAALPGGFPASPPHDPHALGIPPDPRGGYDPAHHAPAFDPRGPAGYALATHQGAPAYPDHHDLDPRQSQARADVQSWDLSHYAPGQIPPGYAGQQHHGAQSFDPRGQPQRHHAGHAGPDANWQQPQGGWHAQGAPGLDPQGYEHGAPGHYHPRPGEAGYQPGGDPHDEGYETDEALASDEKRRGPGTLAIVGALVGAIAVGGGLAYGYKMLGGGIRDKGKPPIVKAEANPARTVPKDAGGKTIEHSDKKFLNRLTTDAPDASSSVASADAPSRNGDVEGTAKKVQSIPITLNRDGTLSPQPGRAPEPPPANSGVPGLVIDGFGPPPGGQQAAPLRGSNGPAPVARALPPPPPPPPPPAVRAAPAAPKVAELPLPKVIQTAPPAPAEPKGPVRKVERLPVPKKSAPVRDDVFAQTGAAPSAVGAAESATRKGSVVATGASGYVAVLASKRSRQDALNSFADLHQQYPDLLANMTPDVREANLAEKGLWYRLIVGPPGSQQAARSLCSKLKERGMKDCWPVAY